MIGRLHFVSAGAGSGKTYRLTDILYSKLASGEAQPGGVIATTFTKKAATELRERVRSNLLERRAFALATAMGQARIGTVNSVCGGLLERFAFEAGLATEQNVLEEAQAMALVREAIDVVLDDEHTAELDVIVFRLGIEDWRDALQQLVNQARANDIEPTLLPRFATENAADLLGHFPRPARGDLTRELEAAIDVALPAIQSRSNGSKKVTNEYLATLQSVSRNLRDGRSTWAEWVKLSKSAPEAALKTLAEPVSEAAGRVAEHPGLHVDVTRYLEILFGLCAETLGVYAARKREMGAVDFTDQEHLLLKTLARPDVAAALREELDLLLVDEFQDTSPIQLALFLKLAEFAKEVYWVGDVKQAIYGFRGSDTALMEAILAAVPSLGGETEILAASWRSRPPLVALVNAVFTKAFAGMLKRHEVELEPRREDGIAGPVFANWLLGGKNKTDEIASLAAGIGRLIGSGQMVFDKPAKQARPVRFGDIALLARSNTFVTDIAIGLRRFGIPTATSQPGLLRTPEAVLALACLRRLNDRTDTLATAEILSLADCAEPEEWLADRLRHLAAGGDEVGWKEAGEGSHPLVSRLAELRQALPLLAPREALELVITQCDLPARVVRWHAKASVARMRLANLEALLALAQKYEDTCRNAQRAGTVSGLVLWLNEQAARDEDYLAEPAIDAVKVMTHHAAKGLEWPVVILLDLNATVRDRLWGISAVSRQAVDPAAPLANRFIRYWPWPFGTQQKVPAVDHIAASETARQFMGSAVAEQKRLLYVSMTRARDLLVFGRSARKPTGPWLDTIEAPWLLTEPDAEELTLPGGVKAPCATWALEPREPDDGSAGQAPALHWLPAVAEGAPRLPRSFVPSSAEGLTRALAEQVSIGVRIPVAPGSDMTTVGIALHACLAAEFTDRAAPLTEVEVAGVLSRFGVAEQIPAAAAHRQLWKLRKWIDSRWPCCEVLTEVPVESVLANGQILSGRIDLLVKVPGGWILIDHKSNPQRRAQWVELAGRYAGQLDAYSEAIEAATGEPVVETWLFFPVSAGQLGSRVRRPGTRIERRVPIWRHRWG